MISRLEQGWVRNLHWSNFSQVLFVLIAIITIHIYRVQWNVCFDTYIHCMMLKYMQLAFLLPLNICLFFVVGAFRVLRKYHRYLRHLMLLVSLQNFKGLLEFSHKDKYYSSATLKCSFSHNTSHRIKMHAKSSVMNKMWGQKSSNWFTLGQSHVPFCLGGGQRLTLWSWSSLSFMWVPGIEDRPSGRCLPPTSHLTGFQIQDSNRELGKTGAGQVGIKVMSLLHILIFFNVDFFLLLIYKNEALRYCLIYMMKSHRCILEFCT